MWAMWMRPLKNAAVTLDEVYRTASQSHAMMEPHASIVDWSDGGQMTVWTSNQMIAWTREALATTLAIDPETIRLESPYVGGGFGGKLWLRADTVLAALGSRAAGRPVKLALPRPLVFNNATHRSGTVQRLRIAADTDGRITAFDHSAFSHTLPGGSGENPVNQTRAFYAGASRRVAHTAIEMDLPESADMRAPRRSLWPCRAGNRHGRNGREAGHGPGRISHPQRYSGRPGRPQ